MLILPIVSNSVSLPLDPIRDPQLLDLAIDFAVHQGPKFITAIGILVATRWGVQRGIHLIDRLIASLEQYSGHFWGRKIDEEAIHRAPRTITYKKSYNEIG